MSVTPEEGSPGLQLVDYRLNKYIPAMKIETTFAPGITVLLGVNGVGKTSLLRSLVHPALRAAGTAAIVDEAGRHDLGHQLVCLLPQRPSLPSNLTVSEVLEYCCYLRGARSEQGRRLLAELDLVGVAERRTHRLSGGETQRLNLALAFVGPPRVALLDEPTVALDPLGRRAFAAALRRVVEADSIVVMSTHVASDIEVADHVQVMDPTGIAWRGRPNDFLALGSGAGFDAAFAELLSGGAG